MKVCFDYVDETGKIVGRWVGEQDHPDTGIFHAATPTVRFSCWRCKSRWSAPAGMTACAACGSLYCGQI